MRVATVITRPDLGGAQAHVRDLCAAMRDRGWDPSVLVGGRGGWLVDELQRLGIPCRSLRWLDRPIRPLADMAALAEIIRVLRALQPDLIAAHSSKAGWLARLAGRVLGRPVVFTVHGWAFTEGVAAGPRWLYLQAERLAAPLTARVIAVSHHDRDLAARYLGSMRVAAVHNGVGDVVPGLRAHPTVHPPHLVMVARFVEQKDQDLLVRALQALADLPWTAELVGGGPLLPAVGRLVGRLGLTGRIALPGVCLDVAERLARAQVSVLASRWEGFPLTVLESMRAGLPVVASRVGGVDEAVEDGVSGLLVPPRDLDALTAALRRLLADAALRARFGAEGRRRWEERFRLEEMVERTMALLEAAVRQRGAAPASAPARL